MYVLIPYTISQTASNKLQKPPQAPPLFNVTPKSILENTKELIQRARDVQDQIVRDLQINTASFNNVLLPLAHVENSINSNRNLISFFDDDSVSTDMNLRKASSKCRELYSDYYRETERREDLFLLIDAVMNKKENLDPECHRLLTTRYNQFIRYGIHLSTGPERDRFREIHRLISQLSLDFEKNLHEVDGGIWFLPEELEGIPEDILSELKKGEGENEGKIYLTVPGRNYYRVIAAAKCENTRRRYLIANENRVAKNASIFKEIVVLRDELARILGYPNHATYCLKKRAAKTPETVNVFLTDLRSRLFDIGQKELNFLKEMKREDFESQGKSFDGKFFLWDEGFYTSKMIRKLSIPVNHSESAEYFPIQNTVSSMLGIFEHLFGLVFEEMIGDETDRIIDFGKSSDLVWNEDVKLFSVWDVQEEGGGFLGYFYLDLFSHIGATNYLLQPVGDIFLRPMHLS